jgi:glycerol-3-phosphate dehydrogenase
VVSAVEHEWALTLEDVLRRRTRVALCDDTNGKVAATDVANLMAAPLGWTSEAAHAAADAYADTVDADRRRWR